MLKSYRKQVKSVAKEPKALELFQVLILFKHNMLFLYFLSQARNLQVTIASD